MHMHSFFHTSWVTYHFGRRVNEVAPDWSKKRCKQQKLPLFLRNLLQAKVQKTMDNGYSSLAADFLFLDFKCSLLSLSGLFFFAFSLSRFHVIVHLFFSFSWYLLHNLLRGLIFLALLLISPYSMSSRVFICCLSGFVSHEHQPRYLQQRP